MKLIPIIIMLIAVSSPLFSQPAQRGPHHRPDRNHGERIEQLMERINSNFPDFYEKLEPLREKNPEIHRKTLRKLSRFARSEHRDPESAQRLIDIFSLEIDLDLLVEKFVNEKDPAKRSELRKEIQSVMSETFDKKEELKLDVINRIEANLAEKKEMYEKRQRDRTSIIKRDIEKIIQNRIDFKVNTE